MAAPLDEVQSRQCVASAWRRVFVVAAFLISVAVPLARLTGPSDLHDQTQEKTSAYSTDIALNMGQWQRWVLPLERGSDPATKPPLYNWIAAPAVAATDGRSEWPHRLPSLLAFAGVCVVLWRLGDRIDPGGLTGPLSAMILASNYAWFKLSVLVRPDTLLSLWLALGWIGITVVLGEAPSARRRRAWLATTWLACALAALTKGPPALALPVFAAVVPWFLPARRPDVASTGRLRRLVRRSAWGLRVSGAWWGLPLALLVSGCWLGLVWRIAPDHLYDTLIREEFVDRAMGTGAEGTKEGPWDLIRTFFNMPLYFITRFVPWSILFFGALIDLRAARRESQPGASADQPLPLHQLWMRSALAFTLLIIIGFTLSAGKRADYIASAYISAALLIAWCLSALGWKLARRTPGLVLAIALFTVGGLIVHDRTTGYAHQYPLADALWDFAREARPVVDSPPHPVAFYRTGAAPLQVMLHRSQRVLSEPAELIEQMERHGSSWLFVSNRAIDELLSLATDRRWTLDLRAASDAASGSEHSGPLKISLYLVTAP